MRRSTPTLGAGALAVLGMVAMLRAATVEVVPVVRETTSAPAVPENATTPQPSWDSLVTLVVEKDLFQPDRRRPPDGLLTPQAAPSEPSIPDMQLRVMGMVTGARPSAVLLGVPGAAGARLVLEGDTVGRYTVRRITADTVALAASDTVIRLTITEPWQ